MAEEAAFFEVSPSSGVPIYRQLVDQVHAMITGGRLRPGDRLPSVRRVARVAAINPMTVSRAYSLLEAEGVVRRLRGQGMEVVSTTQALPLEQRLEEFRRVCREQVRPALYRAGQLGLSPEQVASEIDQEIRAVLQTQHEPSSSKETQP